MFSFKFCVGSWVKQETPEEGTMMNQPKCSKYNNKDEDINPNTLNDKDYQVLSKRFRQIKSVWKSFKFIRIICCHAVKIN